MIWKVEDIAETAVQTEINGRWVRARPINYQLDTLWQRIRYAWLVFRGKADAVVWPEGQ